MEAVKTCLLKSGNRKLLTNLSRNFSVSLANNVSLSDLHNSKFLSYNI